jgi:hypothetical protein
MKLADRITQLEDMTLENTYNLQLLIKRIEKMLEILDKSEKEGVNGN